MITLADIRAARERIAPHIVRTPLLYNRALSVQTGAEIYLKAENLQRCGAFKFRGAMNTLLDVAQDRSVTGVVAASSGNFAQAATAAAKTFDLRAVMVMPEGASPAKIRGVRELGGEVVFGPEDPAPRHATTRELSASEHLTIVHPFDDVRMMAGNGSVGLEILEDLPEVDTVLVPVSGGGLLAGAATAIKEQRPATRIVGVQGAGNGSAKLAFDQGEPVTIPDVETIADGLICRRIGDVTFPVIQRYVDDIVLAPEDVIPRAMAALLERGKLLVEASGAVGLPATTFTVDLEAGAVTGGAETIPCYVPDGVRKALMDGTWDSTATLMLNREKIANIRKSLPYIDNFAT